FHFFFIPLFKWNRQSFLRLRCCSSLYMIDSGYVDELKHSENVNFDRLHKMKIPSNVCPHCGNFIHPNYSYCPYCGQKRC
ncbi:MAG: zinc ribbon domain-containing protein, partial [Tepidanaerobacteraceae bacterium]|nr:zinc ribbon domain-containing protein [Tepidanaerobacteraceae bacterium]